MNQELLFRKNNPLMHLIPLRLHIPNDKNLIFTCRKQQLILRSICQTFYFAPENLIKGLMVQCHMHDYIRRQTNEKNLINMNCFKIRRKDYR